MRPRRLPNNLNPITVDRGATPVVVLRRKREKCSLKKGRFPLGVLLKLPHSQSLGAGSSGGSDDTPMAETADSMEVLEIDIAR